MPWFVFSEFKIIEIFQVLLQLNRYLFVIMG